MLGIKDGKIERKEQDMAKEKIKVDMFNWGPCVVRMKISEEFRKLLLSEAKKNKDDMRGKLAGQIDIETAYSEESKAKIYLICLIVLVYTIKHGRRIQERS